MTITQDGKIINQLSLMKIFCVFVIGECTISSRLIRQFQEHQIIIYLVTNSLKPMTTIGNTLQGNYILRNIQYHRSDEQKLVMSRDLISNKIHNQIELLASIRSKSETLKDTITKMTALRAQVLGCASQASLRGVEGNAAKLFFQSWYEPMGRYRRAPRTREDVINTLLDIGYSYLYGMIESCLSLYGFDVYQGFYHTLFYERKSLVCDMIEPLRCLIDRSIVRARNLKQIQDKQFAMVDHEWVPKDRSSRSKISSLFVRELLDHKGEIFDYAKGYYRYVLGQGQVDFPLFHIKS